MSIRNVQSNALAPRHTIVANKPVFNVNTVTTPWKRNPSWPTLPTVLSTDQKFVGLIAVFPDSTFTALTATTSSGTYTVDWGDGTSAQTYASGSQANYQYSYSASGLTDTPVTFTASTGLVTRNSHGYTNGSLISFAVINTTTGIVVGQKYYVINATANTFQLSATSVGGAITLTNDGTGTILPYKMAIVTVTPTTANLTGFNLNVKNSTAGLNTYESGWLDITVGSPNFTSSGLTISAATINISRYMCEQVTIINLGSCTNMSNMFRFLSALQSVPLFNTAAVTNMSNMFQQCYSLTSVPLFNTAAVTTFNAIFYQCYFLTSVPLFNTAAVTNMTNMFYQCNSLTSVPLFNTAAVTTMAGMFNGCNSLTSVPLFNTAAVTSMNNMFYQCNSLTSVPLFNTATVIDMTNMFQLCYSLTSVPLFNTAAVTNMSGMFQSCPSLTSVPLFNTATVTNMATMFTGCNSLTSVPLFNTAAVTSMNNMFYQCTSLTSVPLFNTAAVTNMATMFQQCYSLTSVPLFNTAAVTSMTAMIQSCTSLTSVPLFNTAAVINMNGMFQSCPSLTSVPALNASAVTSAANLLNIFLGVPQISTINAYGFLYTFSVASLKLSKTALQTLFSNLGIGTGQTLTITSNWGVDTAVAKASLNTTAQSATVNVANTSSLATGMFVTGTGTGITTPFVSVASTVSTNLFTLNHHGLPNGTMVSFSTLGTTTGVSVNTIYYVINSTTNTFQISLTSGGGAITLSGTNSAMTMAYASYITTINTNTSVVFSTPMASTQTGVTLTFRNLDSAMALLRGWAITY